MYQSVVYLKIYNLNKILVSFPLLDCLLRTGITALFNIRSLWSLEQAFAFNLGLIWTYWKQTKQNKTKTKSTDMQVFPSLTLVDKSHLEKLSDLYPLSFFSNLFLFLFLQMKFPVKESLYSRISPKMAVLVFRSSSTLCVCKQIWEAGLQIKNFCVCVKLLVWKKKKTKTPSKCFFICIYFIYALMHMLMYMFIYVFAFVCVFMCACVCVTVDFMYTPLLCMWTYFWDYIVTVGRTH